MFEHTVEGRLDDHRHRKQKAIEISDLQLHELRENSTHTLTVMAGSHEKFFENIGDRLTQNTSVTDLVFKTGVTCEYDSKSQIRPSDWVSLFSAFRSSSRQIESLKLLGCDVPFYTIPTMLWQFRDLTNLQLAKVSGFQWTEKHWQLLSAALRNHPQLVSFKMAFAGNDIRNHAPNDTLADTLAATVPTLKEYVQQGCCTKSVRADSQAPMLRMESVVALIQSTNMEKMTYSHSRILSANSDLALWEALKSTNLVQLSLPLNEIDGPLASQIFRGLQVQMHLYNGHFKSAVYHTFLTFCLMIASMPPQDNKSLEMLDLQGNEFGRNNTVTPTLAAMLGSNTTLTSLNLTDCHFQTTDYIEIVAALRHNSSLVVLQLGASAETMTEEDDDEEHLDDSVAMQLQNDYTLDDPFSHSLLQEFQTLLAANYSSLQFLDISTNDFELEVIEDESSSCHLWSRPCLLESVHAIAAGLLENRVACGQFEVAMDTAE